MSDSDKKIIIRDGTHRNQRLPAALEPGYFNVDETGFERLLAFGVDHAGLLSFYNLEDRKDKTWAPLLACDEAVVFAGITTFDLEGCLDEFQGFFDIGELWPMVKLNHLLAEKIDGWFCQLFNSGDAAGRKLCRRIRHLIEQRLLSDLHTLGLLTTGFHAKDAQQLDFDGFHPVWQVSAHGSSRFANADMYRLKTRKGVIGFLRSCFYRVYNTISLLKTQAESLLDTSLKSQTHSPSVGLFMAFLSLFEKAQESLNEFTRNHLDFYYRDLLKCTPMKALPDKAFLYLGTHSDNRPILVKKGTRFAAAKERIYTSDHDLWVTGAKVVSLKTLFFEQDSHVSPEFDMGMITGAWAASIPVLENSHEQLSGWPLFGATPARGAQTLPEIAGFGFAVADPVLLLREGERCIDVSLTLGHRTRETGKDSIFSHVLTDAASRVETSREDMFFKVFPRIFAISLTTADGWLNIPSYAPSIRLVDPALDPDRLVISFTLSLDTAPIGPYNPAVHGPGYDPGVPMMRFLVNPEAYLYPYSMLDNYFIRKVGINVRVSGVKKLVLYNNLGQLDPNGAFQCFGPMPVQGGYLIVGSHEAATKSTTRMDLNLEWGELPANKEGFGRYYDAYGQGISTSSFKVDASVLRDGQWQVTSPGQMDLFEPSGRDGKVGTTVTLTARDPDAERAVAPLVDEEDFSWDVGARSGFFKFTLVEPEFCFGHKAYPRLLTEVLTHNARPGKFKKNRALPNSPYTPTVNFISMDYRAVSTINPELLTSEGGLEQGRIYSIHPFGTELLFPMTHQRRCPVVPGYLKDGRGNLFIGINSLKPPLRLSLFFHLLEDSRPLPTAGLPVIRVFYLSSNQWREFEKHEVVFDTTDNFLSPGIVALDIPKEINLGNTIVEDNLLWLRVTADTGLKSFCSLCSVTTNGVAVTLKEGDAGEIVLAPGSILEAVPSIPGIVEITQPVPSHGSRAQEDDHALKTRVSERLKHKNRAVTPWDYERLILEQFPELTRVKCFPNTNPQAWNCWEQCQSATTATHWSCENCRQYKKTEQPGHVTIAVVSPVKGEGKTSASAVQPMANSLLLGRIHRYVRQLAPAFAVIHVINPFYERIQVRCTVRFKQSGNEGHDIRMLNQALTDYLSPWNDIGYRGGFGWFVGNSDMLAFIRQQENVAFVTNFSMLRIAEIGEEQFELFDTVSDGKSEPPGCDQGISPRYPWSIAVSINRHFIEIIQEISPIIPARTGVDELEVGNTFIITG
nr:baseplate J/gp47 family protein [uncultured Desulfobacter sp.]